MNSVRPLRLLLAIVGFPVACRPLPLPGGDAIDVPESAAGATPDPGPLIVIRDGGVRWTGASLAAPVPDGYLSQVGFSDPPHGWARGDYTLARTLDGGLSWPPAAWPTTSLSAPCPGPDWRPAPPAGYPR